MSHEIPLFKTKSRYQSIELTHIIPENEAALYLDDAIQFVSGFDEKVYHYVLAGLPAKMLHGKTASALILGGGDGLAARDILRYPNIMHVRMVELDPMVISLSSKHPIMRQINKDIFQNPKLEVIVGDAKEYLRKQQSEKFDLAVLDFPDPLDKQTQLLFTRELYNNLNYHLKPRHIISVQASGVHSDTERLVTKLLKPKLTVPMRFRGKWMEDGSIVYAGNGLDISMAKLPKEYQAASESDIIDNGLVF